MIILPRNLPQTATSSTVVYDYVRVLIIEFDYWDAPVFHSKSRTPPPNAHPFLSSAMHGDIWDHYARAGGTTVVDDMVLLAATKTSIWTLGCQRWQSCVADFFCYFWAVFSKRTFLTKSVVWKGAQQTLSIPPAAAEGLQVHFNMGASTMPRRQPKSVPQSML